MSDNNKMISDEAVEAAAKVMQAKDRSEGFGEYELYEYRDDAREILEAAAPYLMAQAWDEGARDGQWNAEHIFRTDAGARHAIENPYRSRA